MFAEFIMLRCVALCCVLLSYIVPFVRNKALFIYLYIHEMSVNKGNTAVWFRDVSMFCEHLHVAPSGGQPSVVECPLSGGGSGGCRPASATPRPLFG